MKTLACFEANDIKINALYRVSPDFRSETALDEYEFIKLAHATTSKFKDSILEKGLLPRKYLSNCFQDNLHTDDSSVYLLSTVDEYYGKRAAKECGGKSIYIMCRVAIDNLIADENKIGQQHRDSSEKHKLFISIQGGACKHKGAILPEHIYAIFDNSAKTLYSSE